MAARKGTRRSRPSRPDRRASRRALWLIGAGLSIAVVAAVAVALLLRPGAGAPTPDPWARLGTQDVHSLAFPGPDRLTVLFGHHGGILRSTDGGRLWQPLPVRQDAMGMAAATDGSVIIAGHLVFQGSQDGGTTWAPIEADLPSLDIHSFARSLSDPARMWAYLAEGGIYESADGGHSWTRVHEGSVTNLTATRDERGDTLLGIDLRGLVRSGDGGRTWTVVGTPPVAPVISLAATADGRVIVLGATDGLYRADDSGASWRQILQGGPFLAVAVWSDGSTIAAVDGDTDFYRSDDGGATWPGVR